MKARLLLLICLVVILNQTNGFILGKTDVDDLMIFSETGRYPVDFKSIGKLHLVKLTLKDMICSLYVGKTPILSNVYLSSMAFRCQMLHRRLCNGQELHGEHYDYHDEDYRLHEFRDITSYIKKCTIMTKIA